jgi:hypothetical protein
MKSVWTNKKHNTDNNLKGMTPKQQKQIMSLQRTVNEKQKVVDNKSKRATNKQGNGGKR